MEDHQVNEENKQPEQEAKEIEQPPEENNLKNAISQETEINDVKNTQDISPVSLNIFIYKQLTFKIIFLASRRESRKDKK